MTSQPAWRMAALSTLIAFGLTAPPIQSAAMAGGLPSDRHCPWLNRLDRPDIKPAAIEWLERCLAGLPTTKSMHSTDRGYTEERQKLHDGIIKTARSGKSCVTTGSPFAILTGGPPGAGKTTWLKRHLPRAVLQNSY